MVSKRRVIGYSAPVGRNLRWTPMNTDLASRARSLAERHLVDVPRRWAHVKGVAAGATAVAPALDPEHAESIVAAAWLHDIGYATDLAVSGFHPVDGARFAMDVGMPDLVVSLIAFHTGAEFEALQRGLLVELHEFAAPPVDILDVVTFADMTTSLSGESIAATDRVAEILTRYEPDTVVYNAVSRSAPQLLGAVQRVNARLLRANATRAHPR